jgi:outer membrane protein
VIRWPHAKFMIAVLVAGLFAVPAASAGVPWMADPSTQKIQTLEQALAWSYGNNPGLQSARAAFRAAQETLPQAMAGWQPTVVAGADITAERISGREGNGTTSKQIDASFTQPLFHGGQTLAAVKSARNTIEAQRALLRDRVQQTMLQAVTAYMNVVRDESLLEVADNNVKDLREQLKAVRARFSVGNITKTDVSQAEAALAKAQADRTAALGNLRTSNAAFEQVIGFLPAKLEKPNVNLPIPPTLDEAKDFGDRYNPQVVASAYLQESSRSDIDRAFGQLLPRIDLNGDVGHVYDPQPGGEPDTTARSIGISASIPLYTGGLIQSQVRQARHTANQRYLDILNTKRLVRESIVSGWETFSATRAEIDSRKAQVKAARVALDGIRQEATVGTRTVLDALNTEQEYLIAKVSLVTAQRDEVVAAYTLAAALGLLTPDTLGFPEIPGYEGGKPASSAHVDKGRVR